MATGTSRLSHLSRGADVGATGRAIRLLGATTTATRVTSTDASSSTAHDPEETILVVEGCGMGGLGEPSEVIDVGNSGTLLRLLPGVLAGIDGVAVLSGDASVNQRPVDRIIRPLAQMGAKVDARRGGTVPPLWIRGGALRGIHYTTPVASAQIKSAVLLAGLFAEGETMVTESTETRPHTEEFLTLCGVPHERAHEPDGAHAVRLQRAEMLRPFDVTIPADPSQAAFWAVAAAIAPESQVELRSCYAGRSRAGYLNVLVEMGAMVSRMPGTDLRQGLPVEDVVVTGAPLRGVEVGGAAISTMIDEIPILAVAACFAEGTTRFRDIGELRVKESDRISSTAAMLRAFGATVHTEAEALIVTGQPDFRPTQARVDAKGDHRIAMAAAIMASRSREATEIDGYESVATSYVGFGDDYARVIHKSIETP
jgi:3-phosphoshikimate 1-carboxyvinyltransferase